MSTEPQNDPSSQRDESDHIRQADARDPRADSLTFRRAVWLIWWIGTAVIVMSWFHIVSNTIGWIGFAAALASTLASTVANRYWRPPQ